MDFSPLADVDPVPGDPAAVHRWSSAATAVADDLAEARTHVERSSVAGIMVGLAADRFEETRAETGEAAGAAEIRLDEAAGAARRYADALEEAQDQAREALRRARDAEARIAAATAGIAAMRRHALTEARRVERLAAAGDETARPRPWEGPDHHALLAEADGEMAAARALLDVAVAARDAAAQTFTSTLVAATAPGRVARSLVTRFLGLVGVGVGGGVDRQLEFVVTDGGLVVNTRQGWQQEAYRLAGIAPDEWRPELGLHANAATARNAWDLYGELYGKDPDTFLWAGMAKLAGGTFYAGFQDLAAARTAIERGEDVGEVLRRLLPPTTPTWVVNQLVGLAVARGSEHVAGELAWVERQFLHMQRDIFDDLAWQHLAYREGGLPVMDALREGGQIHDSHHLGWTLIDEGRVSAGNAELLHHEQRHVIGASYDDVRERSTVTWALTEGMGLVGQSPVPEGETFTETVGWRANVSVFEDRWEWIESTMYPEYLDFREQPYGSELIAAPVERLAEPQRLLPWGYGPRGPRSDTASGTWKRRAQRDRATRRRRLPRDPARGVRQARRGRRRRAKHLGSA
jgi:hypothetical protein